MLRNALPVRALPARQRPRHRAGLARFLLACVGLAAPGAVAVDWLAEAAARPSAAAMPRMEAIFAAWFRSRMPAGAAAPDFALPRFAGGGEVRLSGFRGHRPVVLAFGSFG